MITINLSDYPEEQNFFRLENAGPEVDKWFNRGDYHEQDQVSTSTYNFCRDCVDGLTAPITDKALDGTYIDGKGIVRGYNGDPLGTEWSGPVDTSDLYGDDYGCDICGDSLEEMRI